MCELGRVLDDVTAWQHETFPTATTQSRLAHLREEVTELVARPDSGEEMADVLMLLSALAEGQGIDLAAEVERKLAMCRQRSWGQPNAQGYVKATAKAPGE